VMSSDGSDCYDVEMEGEADKAGVPVVELSDDSDSATPAAATKVSNGVKGKTQDFVLRAKSCKFLQDPARSSGRPPIQAFPFFDAGLTDG